MKKSSHNGGCECDLMTSSHSGLLFWATLYTKATG